MSNTQQNQPKQTPVAKVRYGRVQGALWRKGTDRTWHEVTLQRGFRKKDGTYGNSHSFDLLSALALRAALDEAIPLLRDLDNAARTPLPEPEPTDDGAYIDDENYFHG
jgi:hypothetical protein